MQMVHLDQLGPGHPFIVKFNLELHFRIITVELCRPAIGMAVVCICGTMPSGELGLLLPPILYKLPLDKILPCSHSISTSELSSSPISGTCGQSVTQPSTLSSLLEAALQ